MPNDPSLFDYFPPTPPRAVEMMKQSLLQEKYPIFLLELDKSETRCQSVDEILDYLKQKIEAHNSARYIATFDHYSHTKGLEENEIDPELLDAKNIIFCFGISLPDPKVLAVRPRSIGVAETATGFVISFMEAPMPVANLAMERWVKSLLDQHSA